MFLEEDYNIQVAYYIYLLVELYLVPPSLVPRPQKEISDVLKPVFKLCEGEERNIYEPIPNRINLKLYKQGVVLLTKYLITLFPI